MNPSASRGLRVLGILALAIVTVWVGGMAAAQTTAPAATPASTAPAAAAASPAMPSTTPAAGTPAATVAPAAPSRPTVKGVLSGNNVYIRKGPGTEYPFYLSAPMGYEVEAVGQKGEWLEIEFPAKEFSWVSKDYLQKIDDKTGIIIGSNVNVRMGPGLQFDRVYSVPVGQKFQIRGMDIKGEWYQVSPMPGETAWILAPYVRLSGPLPSGAVSVAPVPEPAGVTPVTAAVSPVTTVEPAIEPVIRPIVEPVVAPRPVEPEPLKPDPYAGKLAAAEEMFRAETAKENPADWDLASLQEKYTDIEANASSTAVKAQARSRLSHLKAYKGIQDRAKEIGMIDEELQGRLKELEKQRAAEITAIPAAVDAPFTATGLVEKFYIKDLKPATHKLTEGTTILYLLASDVVDLPALEGKRCGVRGRIVANPGTGVRLIEVNTCRVLGGAEEK